ncbi:HNH endonuclease [Halalkalibacter oceani]|uniref:HNH endonuclease n=1 Tax=Halalkalibacter oceani TaxID=1653776 RepID=UPI003398734C
MRNNYEVRGDVTAIFLNHKGQIYETLIDTADLEKVKSMTNTWFLNDNGYVRANFPADRVNRGSLRLHRFILNAPKDKDVDHINGDKLDNRKSNLRLVTRGENNQNQKLIRKNTKSRMRGVSWFERDRKWRAYVSFKGKQKHLGYFDTIEEAALAASRARRKYLPFSNENLKAGERFGS